MLCNRRYYVSVDDLEIEIPVEFHGELDDDLWSWNGEEFSYAVPDLESGCDPDSTEEDVIAWGLGDVWCVIKVRTDVNGVANTSSATWPYFGREAASKEVNA